MAYRGWRYAWRTERQEIALVRRLIRPGDCAIDVGAHKAAFTYWMAKRAGKAGLVLAFEPIPELANYLRSYAGSFSDGRLRVYELGLSSEPGTATLHFPRNNLGGASIEITDDVMRPPIDITVTTLDGCLSELDQARPVTFIKCDVEQHELAVFQGANVTLTTHKPVVLFESGNLATGASAYRPVFDLLESAGYSGYFFGESSLIPVDEFSPERYPVREDSAQNYVFVHPERMQQDARCAATFRIAA